MFPKRRIFITLAGFFFGFGAASFPPLALIGGIFGYLWWVELQKDIKKLKG